MTPEQMHIEVRQGVQQVAANKTYKYLPQELDLILNKMQDRLIKMQLAEKKDDKGKPTGGFEISQLGADIIRPLVVNSTPLVPFIVDAQTYKCFLPYDYSYLLSDWSFTALMCDDTEPLVTSDTLYLTALRQELSNAATPNYYNTLVATLGGRTVNLPVDLTFDNAYQGYPEKSQINEITQFIAKRGAWYWERVGNQTFPGFYINLSTDPNSATGALITIDGATSNNVKLAQTVMTSHRTITGKYYDNRLTASDNISGMNSTEFYKSSFYSPISELSTGFLYIYRSTNFIVSGVGITYIRKPDPISISLNTKSELPEEFHSTICDLAVEYIQGRLQNVQAWQQTLADNERRVTI